MTDTVTTTNPPTTHAPAIAPEEVLAILETLNEVGSVELKMTVPAEQRVALRAMKVDPLLGKLREVVFFDTPDLDLFKHGLVVRGRRTQLADDDTVVKLRPVVPAELPAGIRNSPNLKLELDVTRGNRVVSASLQGKRPAGVVQETLAGARTLEKMLTKEQRPFLEQHFPDGVGYHDLVPLGPSYVILLKQVPADFHRKLTLEVWHFPGQVPLVELSTKTAPGDVARAIVESREFLGRYGIRATGEQETKTRKALEFFAKLLPKQSADQSVPV